jgi:hypothetical protein
MSTGPTPAVRQMVAERARHRCERCGIIMGRPPHIHHRQPRKMGGSSRPSINYPGNLLHLCPFCHVQVEGNRTPAILSGWLVTEPRIPADTPVKLWDGWFLLDDNGARISVDVPAGVRGLSDPTPDG